MLHAYILSPVGLQIRSWKSMLPLLLTAKLGYCKTPSVSRYLLP